jgi:metallo-beta-lactamase family protein
VSQVEIQFFGAARQTTGSKHLISARGKRILFDCGLVQGPRKKSNEANRQLPFDARSVDCVILSHAHIDHSGTLPKLVRDGFRGRIWCTRATADLAAVMLLDAAKIQESDAAWLDKHRPRDERVEPLYTTADAERTIKLLRGVHYRELVEIGPGLHIFLRDAGHIMGSATVELRVEDAAGPVRIGFTGDLGRRKAPILRDPEPFGELDYLITEATYGDRDHPPMAELERQLAALVHEESDDGGRILIPSFAVGRAQHVIYMLGRLLARREIPELPIYLDSPLAKQATKVLASHPETFDEEVRGMIERSQQPFFYPGIRYVESVEESKELNWLKSPHIVIAASGMCESGRILHHLKQSVGRPEDCLLIVGYQAEATLGRRLLEGAREARIYGELYPVRMKVRKMNGFSAHADRNEIISFLKPLASSVKTVFVVHGEEGSLEALAARLAGAGFKDVVVPVQGQKARI